MITRRDLLKGAAYVTAGASAGVALGVKLKAVDEPCQVGFGMAPTKPEGQAVDYDEIRGEGIPYESSLIFHS